MPKKKNKEEKDPPVETLEERVARGIREGWIRPAKAQFNWEEWERLPKPDIDPETAAWIIRDLIENR
ncbi:MAG TPA: hypothetical protein VN493_30520 [Thermoanaerobaculia bacterium]|nr:hypothetical protein [Thermoanaerobaculia bacterium]